MNLTSLLALVVVASALGCVSARDHANSLHSADQRQTTLGLVQREIHNGMSQADVAESLGAPNIVTKDDQGMETWIYDKIATEASYSSDRGGVTGGAAAAASPGSVLLLGLLGGSYDAQSGASAVSQRTLTVVVKFDRQSKVASSSYHSSSF